MLPYKLGSLPNPIIGDSACIISEEIFDDSTKSSLSVNFAVFAVNETFYLSSSLGFYSKTAVVTETFFPLRLHRAYTSSDSLFASFASVSSEIALLVELAPSSENLESIVIECN